MQKNKKTTNIISLFLITTCVVLFLALFFLVVFENPTLIKIDTGVASFFERHRTTFLNYLSVILSYLGETETIVVFCIILLCLKNRKKIGIPITFLTIISLALNFAIKILVQRFRPDGYFLTESVLFYTMPTGYSFPSGHAQTASIFYFALIFFLTSEKSQKTKLWSMLFAGLFCVAISLSRIYLGVHYLSDILAGLLLMLTIFLTYVLIIKKQTNVL